MTYKEIKYKIESLERNLERDHFDHKTRDFVPATGHTRTMILANIEDLRSRLPMAKHDDSVRLYGWKSVERNV